MKPEIERAMREVLEAWETPDSPEAFAGAMYQMKRVHRAAVDDSKSRKKPGRPRKHSRHNAGVLAHADEKTL